MTIGAPNAVLFDYGGTLVEELGFDMRAATELLLSRASHRPANARLDAVMERVALVTRDVAARRDRFHIETPWPSLARLIHDYFGTRFDEPWETLEQAYWDAGIDSRPMPGARDALDELHRAGLPLGVISNSSFTQRTMRHELDRNGVAEHLAIVVSSADYAVRKPNPLIFETAAALIGMAPRDVWFVGDRLDTDVAGARAAGMTAVWFNPRGDAPPESNAADLTVRDWRSFMDAFREARG